MTYFSVSDIPLPPPWTNEGRPNALQWFSEAHKRAPIGVDDMTGTVLFLGYQQLRDFLAKPKLWSVAKREDWIPPEKRFARLLTTDPPLHLALRAQFANAYRPQRIARLEKLARAKASQLIDHCIGLGSFDVIADFMKPLSIEVICELIGIPEDRGELMDAIGELGTSIGPARDAAEVNLVDQLNAGTELRSAARVAQYFHKVIEQRRACPEDDLISNLVTMPKIEADVAIDIAVFLFEQFGAGTNTTVHLFSSMLAELNARPELYRALKADRSLATAIIEETLRLHSPLQGRPRVATADYEVAGLSVSKGTWGVGWLAAANVDPAKFPAPLEFDVKRPSQHLAFGRNEHFCLGAHLARMELRVALDAWLDRIFEFEEEDSGQLAWLNDFIIHGLAHYRVRVS